MHNNTISTSRRPAGLLTPADVGERLGLPSDTIRSWVRRDVVRATRFGKGNRLIALRPSVIDELRREA
jgi:excisionase family DNA binding protein